MATDEELDEMAQRDSDFQDFLNEKADAFDALVDERLEAKQEEEGSVLFLEQDVVTEYLNTLADTVNLCRMQAVKLMVLQDSLVGELGTKMGKKAGEDIQIGAQSFQGMGGKK